MKYSLITLLGVSAVTVFVAIGFIYNSKLSVPQPGIVSDYKNATYIMPDGTSLTLIDGMAEKVLSVDMATKIVSRYFGNELYADINNDGREDVIFIITEDRGGSGTYFYVVAALNTRDGYIGSDAVLLGDRIAPQTTELSQNPNHQNVIVVNYADRAVGEPMTAQPSIGKSLYLKLDQNNRWGIVESDFEGEADSERMTLSMKQWEWQRVEYSDGRTIVPRMPNTYTLTFINNGRLEVGTDCNNAGGEYIADVSTLTISNMLTTLMYCEGSQETEFIKLLEDTTSFHFTSRGELVLNLKDDSGTVIFK